MTAKQKVLLVGFNETRTPEWEKFEEDYDVIQYDIPSSRQQVIEDFKTKFNDISAIISTWLGLYKVGRVEGDMIDAFPPTLKVITGKPAGFDPFDIPALKARGIVFCNTPTESVGAADRVADAALILVLNAYRFTNAFEYGLRKTGHVLKARSLLASDKFDNETGLPVADYDLDTFGYGHQVGGKRVLDPRGQTVGIVGFGAIGRSIARRLHVIGMKIHYHKRQELSKEEAEALGVPAVYHESLKDILETVDTVVLALPLTPETKYMINKETIAHMKPGVKIINVGRGALIRESELVEALESGHVSAAGLDVYENEPYVSEKLLKRWDVMLLPHIGSATFNNSENTLDHCVRNIRDVLENNGPGITPV